MLCTSKCEGSCNEGSSLDCSALITYDMMVFTVFRVIALLLTANGDADSPSMRVKATPNVIVRVYAQVEVAASDGGVVSNLN